MALLTQDQQILLHNHENINLVNSRLQTSSNIAKVLSLRAMFEVVELLLGLSLSFVGGVGVADRAGKKCQYRHAPVANEFTTMSKTYALRPAATCVGSLPSLSVFP
jgi:hypothetical protein